MSISVIIPSLHSPLIAEVITALRKQTVARDICEIIVVGLDRYNQVVPDELVRFVHTPRPISAAAARNRGAAIAQGDYLLFVDSDCLLAAEALERLLEVMQMGYGAVVGAVVPEVGNYWILSSNLMAFPENLTIDRMGERTSLPSFCLLLPHVVWHDVGTFDECFPGAAGEDLDLSFRLRRAGYRLACQPAAAVRHRPARTSLGSLWHHNVAFGRAWHVLYHRHRQILPFSPAVWLCDFSQGWSAFGSVPLACLYVLRLVARRRYLLRFWFAIPGMIWAQLGWYNGIQQRARRAAGPH